MNKAKLMLGNAVETSLIFRRILGSFVLSWAPNHYVLGAQLASVEIRLVCIPEICNSLTLLISYMVFNPFKMAIQF